MDHGTFMIFVKMALRDQVPYTFRERFDESTVSPVTIIDARTKKMVSSGVKYHLSIRVS